jgi:hypothetical protein
MCFLSLCPSILVFVTLQLVYSQDHSHTASFLGATCLPANTCKPLHMFCYDPSMMIHVDNLRAGFAKRHYAYIPRSTPEPELSLQNEPDPWLTGDFVAVLGSLHPDVLRMFNNYLELQGRLLNSKDRPQTSAILANLSKTGGVDRCYRHPTYFVHDSSGRRHRVIGRSIQGIFRRHEH